MTKSKYIQIYELPTGSDIYNPETLKAAIGKDSIANTLFVKDGQFHYRDRYEGLNIMFNTDLDVLESLPNSDSSSRDYVSADILFRAIAAVSGRKLT